MFSRWASYLLIWFEHSIILMKKLIITCSQHRWMAQRRITSKVCTASQQTSSWDYFNRYPYTFQIITRLWPQSHWPMWFTIFFHQMEMMPQGRSYSFKCVSNHFLFSLEIETRTPWLQANMRNSQFRNTNLKHIIYLLLLFSSSSRFCVAVVTICISNQGQCILTIILKLVWFLR